MFGPLTFPTFQWNEVTGQIGFLQEHRRTNVAMTRARKHLLIVGDTATLGADAVFAGLIERAEVEGVYRSAWEFV